MTQSCEILEPPSVKPESRPGPSAPPVAPSGETRRSRLRPAVRAYPVVSLLAFAFAYLYPADFRSESVAAIGLFWVAFVIRTFLFQIGLLTLLQMALAAWLRCRWALAASVPLLAIGFGPDVLRVFNGPPAEVAGETLTIMSVNLLAENRLTQPILGEILAADPDILLVQEYPPHWHTAIQAALGARYPHVRYELRLDSFGAAIYSKRPFVGEVELNLPLADGPKPQIRAVVRVAGREVAIYNIHLEPPTLFRFGRQSRQFADLADLLAAETLPAIVAGDFNFTPRSRHAAALHRLGFSDAHTLAGRGRGATWPYHHLVPWLPGVRIDHIYLSGQLTAVESRTGVCAGSDHRPVVAELGFPH